MMKIVDEICKFEHTMVLMSDLVPGNVCTFAFSWAWMYVGKTTPNLALWIRIGREPLGLAEQNNCTISIGKFSQDIRVALLTKFCYEY